jgi:hypothetical protein
MITVSRRPHSNRASAGLVLGEAQGALRRLFVTMAGTLLFVAASACTEFADGDDALASQQLETSDTLGDDTSDNDWSCLSGLVGRNTSLTPTDRNRPLSFSMRITDNVGNVPQGLTARACSNLDPECMMSVTEVIPADPNGVIELTLYQGFFGFLEILGTDIVSTLYFFPDVLTEDTEGPTIRSITDPQLRALAALNGVQIDPARGHMALIVEDCAGARASGVELANDKGGITFYYLAGIPTNSQASTAADGVGGFVNLASGQVSVRAVLANARRDEVTAKSMYVRPGWMTVSVISPPVAARSVR